MLVLLPPSEGKTPAPAGAPPLDLASLSHPGLTEPRRRVLAALVAASARTDASRILGTGPRLAAEVAANVDLPAAPTAPASAVYTGVLYAAAGLGNLPPVAADRAARDVLIVSALFGALSPADRIPAYRLAMGTDLPPIGPLAAFWRRHLAASLDERARHELVLDGRSAPYVAAWRPPADADWVAVRVVRERAGRRTSVAHHAKHARGLLTRHLLLRAEPVHHVDDVDKAARELVGAGLIDATLRPPATRGGPVALELVVG